MKFLIINCGSSKVPDIEKMVSNLGAQYVTQHQDEIKLDDTFDGIIISGAPILLTEKDPVHYLKNFEFLLSIHIPVLGICFGHQIVGMLHNAKITRCIEDRNWQKIELKEKDSLFEGFQNIADFKEDHCECIDLPQDFLLLASSPACTNEAMKHKTKSIYGVQFHPEVSEMNGARLFENFANICKKHQ